MKQWNDGCVQAKQLCTTNRAIKVVVAMTLAAFIAQAINMLCLFRYYSLIIHYIYNITFRAVVPLAVLIINAIVVREVRRRASSNAASNLGVQHHQSTSSNSAVPSVMLVTTSLIYVVLYGLWSFADLAHDLRIVSEEFYSTASVMGRFVYAYNFYVYWITGEQFRSELRALFCRCCCFSSSSSSANDDVRVPGHGQANTAVWISRIEMLCSHRHSQDFVWGALFSSQKLTTFLVVAFKRRSKITNWSSKSSPHSKIMSLKIDSCSAWGMHLVCWGALTNFPCKLRLIYFLRPLVCRGTHCTPWLYDWRKFIREQAQNPIHQSCYLTFYCDLIRACSPNHLKVTELTALRSRRWWWFLWNPLRF